MLFNFRLRHVDEIAPWGEEGDYSLSWFGLTDGCYWMDCGGQELFRHSDAIIEAWKRSGHPLSDPPYMDYQIVRLWEDLLEILPAILSPVPQQILERIKPGREAAI